MYHPLVECSTHDFFVLVLHGMALHIPMVIVACNCSETSHEVKHMLILLVPYLTVVISLMSILLAVQTCAIGE